MTSTRILVIILVVMLFQQVGMGQFTFDGFAEIEITESGDDSHFFYNGIDEERTGWSGGFAGMALYSGYQFNKIDINLQQSLMRYQGKHQLKYRIEQLNLNFKLNNQHEIAIGRYPQPVHRSKQSKYPQIQCAG